MSIKRQKGGGEQTYLALRQPAGTIRKACHGVGWIVRIPHVERKKCQRGEEDGEWTHLAPMQPIGTIREARDSIVQIEVPGRGHVEE